MKNLLTSFILTLVISISMSFDSKCQTGPPKPNSFIDPSHDTFFMMDLDSVVKFSYSDNLDSTLLNKWEYSRNNPSRILTALRFNWDPAARVYHLGESFETGYDANGHKNLQAHYYHSWVLNREWGCASEGCGRKEWTYDQLGNQTKFTQYYWSKDQKDWVKFYQILNEFDQQGNQTLVAQFSREKEGDPWLGSYKYEYSYNEENLVWGGISYTWDRNEHDWRFFIKTLSEYPDPGIVLATQYNYSQEEHEWDESYKDSIVTEHNGSIKTEIQYDWNEQEGDWIPYTKKIYHLNEAGKSVSYYRFFWDKNQQLWNPFNSSQKEFDLNGKLRMEASYVWSEKDSAWVGATGHSIAYWKRTYDYDTNGNLRMYTQYDWDVENKKWVGVEDGQIEIKYTPEGRIAEEIRRDWDSDSNMWQPTKKLVLDYDADGEVENQTQYNWDINRQDWLMIIRHYFYNSISTSKQDFARTDLKLFPNPSNGLVSISGMSGKATIRVYTLQGRLLKSILSDTDRIDLGALPSGVYIIHIDSSNGSYREKHVIK